MQACMSSQALFNLVLMHHSILFYVWHPSYHAPASSRPPLMLSWRPSSLPPPPPPLPAPPLRLCSGAMTQSGGLPAIVEEAAREADRQVGWPASTALAHLYCKPLHC